MNTEELKNTICDIFKDSVPQYRKSKYCRIEKIDDGFEISISAMYEAPTISFETLKKISGLFGTDKIDMDNFGHGGCETCDYGSDYGHTIQIYNPILNIAQMNELVGKDIFNLE